MERQPWWRKGTPEESPRSTLEYTSYSGKLATFIWMDYPGSVWGSEVYFREGLEVEERLGIGVLGRSHKTVVKY